MGAAAGQQRLTVAAVLVWNVGATVVATAVNWQVPAR